MPTRVGCYEFDTPPGFDFAGALPPLAAPRMGDSDVAGSEPSPADAARGGGTPSASPERKDLADDPSAGAATQPRPASAPQASKRVRDSTVPSSLAQGVEQLLNMDLTKLKRARPNDASDAAAGEKEGGATERSSRPSRRKVRASFWAADADDGCGRGRKPCTFAPRLGLAA
jgi:hypothetical protein